MTVFAPNAWMKVFHFNVLTSCQRDKLHQWFIGLYIILAIVHRKTKVLQRTDLVTLNKDGILHPLLSGKAVARVFKRLASAQARNHAGAAMSMRSTVSSTPGCGTLAGPSLELVAFRSPKPK